MTKENIRYAIWISAVILIQAAILLYQQNEISEPKTTSEPSVDYWKIFARIKKERKYIEEASAYYRIPVFTPELLDLSGKEVVLSGYFLPYSRLDSVIIVSRYPNSSCFYCGLAGIESVAMVELGRKDPQYRTDQRMIVRGKLMLNNTNIDKLAFVLEDGTVDELIK